MQFTMQLSQSSGILTRCNPIQINKIYNYFNSNLLTVDSSWHGIINFRMIY